MLSAESYDALKALAEKVELAENISLIQHSRDDFKAGSVHDAHASVRQLADEHGLDLSR